jgi:hypothetical protein
MKLYKNKKNGFLDSDNEWGAKNFPTGRLVASLR